MFEDFSKDETSAAARKRFRGSIAVAALVYTTVGAAIVGATATAKKVVEEQLTQVEFAPPPEPEPEPEPPPPEEAPKPVASQRPKMKRAAIKPPDEIPLEKPKESDAELSAAAESGPVDGFLDGVEGGKGGEKPAPPPPAPKPEVSSPPVPINTDQPKYPKAAERKGIEGTVIVAFDVLESGAVANPKIVSGPVELHEAVLKTALTWRYRPAKLAGKPVRHRMTRRVTFRLEDA